MSQRYGLARGFQWWSQRLRANLASVLPGLFDAIGTSPARPLFLVLHTYDVHGPYDYLPPSNPVREEGGVEGEIGARDLPPAEWDRLRGLSYHQYQQLDRFDGLPAVVDAYDRGIRFVDAQLGRLFDRLRDIGIYDDMLIIVTSDHGESLNDRDLYIGHTYGLHDEELRVPLVVRLPRGQQRGRSNRLVGLVDLVPLVLGVTGVGPAGPSSGLDPLVAISGDHLPREVRGEASHTGAQFARSARFKWIGPAFAPDDDRQALPRGLRDRFRFDAQAFDLQEDPDERLDLAAGGDSELPPDLAALRDRVRDRRATESGGPRAAPGDLDPAEAARLRALGYLAE
jgi:arylsulfatase A-like enzyme